MNTITSITTNAKHIKVEIVRATTIITGNTMYQPSYKNMVGKKIFVRKSNQPAYYETKSGYPVLMTDCRMVRK